MVPTHLHRNLDGLRPMTSESWVMVGGQPNLPSGHDGIRALFEHIGQIEQTWTIEDIIGEGDKVVVRDEHLCPGKLPRSPGCRHHVGFLGDVCRPPGATRSRSPTAEWRS